MYRIYRFHAGIAVVGIVSCFQQYDGKRGLPVVAMEHLRKKAFRAHQFKHCNGEKRKPFGIVELAVNSVAEEIIFIVDKIPFHPVPFKRKNAAIKPSPRERDRYALFKCHPVTILLSDF